MLEKVGEKRPSPEALLELAERENRGRLKVFLGASPGVGKTYAMLAGAQRLKGEGRDVVIGLVETHGRPETALLLEGLELLPRRAVSYKGHTLLEFDIDAALKRRPSLIVVDELAHTNAPDSRHPKRYQDVEELLEAGIDVWTAMNIQHVESLTDVVSTITGVKVRELVPDTVIEKADDVVVVDITPDELIQRLKEGKVYLPENARRAEQNFLKAGNLTALRELALRRTAERVDDQMVSYLRQNAIEGPWPTAERILVCVGADAQSQAVVRIAARLATGLNASWIAVHLAVPGSEPHDAGSLKRIDDALALAQRLGAETTRLSARDLPSEVHRFALRQNITLIVIGRSRSGWLKRLLRRSLSDEIVRQAKGIGVHVVTGEESRSRLSWHQSKLTLTAAAAAPLAVGAALAVGLVASRWLELPNLSMIFLTAVLFCAVTFGIWSAIIAAALSFVVYNFFFIEPVYTLTVASPHELLALVVFLLVAVLTGGLAGRVRDQSIAAQARVKQTQALFDFSRKLSGTAKLDDILWLTAGQTATAIKGQTIILLVEGEDLAIKAAFPPEDTLGTAEWAAARWSFQRGESAGWNTTTLPRAQYQFRPLQTSRGTIGVMGFRAARQLSVEEERMLESLSEQSAIAIDRTLLVEEATSAKANAASESLRSALLSSISHDLRTPLSSILGAVSTLRTLGGKLPKADSDDLLMTIEEEASRLARFVANLLDMTRLEGGSLDAHRELVDLPGVVQAAARRARQLWPKRQIRIAATADLPPVKGETAMLEQVVFNILDNANKFAPPGLLTSIALSVDGNDVVLSIEDEGPGIAAEDLDRVFDKFYRGKEGDGRAPGTGLGLAICRGLVTAMGGSIRVESPVARGKGTRIVVRLPGEGNL